LTTNATATLVQAGTNATPSVTLDSDGQALLSRRFVVPVKATNNTISGVALEIYAPDSSNRYLYTCVKVGTYDGWELWAFRDITPTTTVGTPNLANAVRSRINVTCSANAVVGEFHFGAVYAYPLPTPSVVITLDDGTVSWPWVAAEAAKRGIPVSFGITGENINAGYGLTEAEIIGLANDYDGLHEVNNHNATHDTYTTLGLATFMTNMEANRARLLALGLPARPLLFHAYPSGDFDATLMASMRSAGYLCGRGTGAGLGTRCALNNVIAIDGADAQSLYEVYMACSLKDTVTLTQAKAYIEATAATGTAFVIGHKFEAAASATGWIKGYDDTSGLLNLLDWLAEKRDVSGWKLRKWSDWYDDQLSTRAGIPL
jgi:peptidoglycan/xylan/chitin deacetylase (PgdA/CDA1 family)